MIVQEPLFDAVNDLSDKYVLGLLELYVYAFTKTLVVATYGTNVK